MRLLIYATAFITPEWKEQFIDMTTKMVDSVRLSGFKGDMMVMSDQDLSIPGADLLKIKDMKFKLGYNYDLLLMRARLHHYVDITKYDYVMYLDSDVLANQSLTPMFTELIAKNAISAQGEGRRVGQSRNTHSYELTPEEMAKWKHKHVFCAGGVGFPGNEYGLKFLQDYEEAVDTCTSNDQHALNAMLLRKYDGKAMPIPGMWFKVDSAPAVGANLLHFYRRVGKPAFHRYYDEVLKPIIVTG